MAVKREDLSCLEKFDEGSVLEVLRSRYAQEEIYTNCGEILLAVNPYKTLPIFDDENHEKYDWKRFEAKMPPHVFNVAARAYQRIREAKTDQVILVSGESGAGKTESTKLMVKHLVYMCPNGSDDLHNKIVQVNPLLEAFGNAQTIMNDNSSRFAKFVELSFDESGQVLGGAIRDYMLEKSRVVTFNKDEGNFHIFYSLFAGTSKQQLSDLNLSESKDYRIMKCGCLKLLEEKTKYRAIYTQQIDALKRIGFDQDDINILHCMLGAIIHLTEVKFKEADKANEPLKIVNTDQVEQAAQLLNVEPVELCLALIKTKTDYGGEQIYCLKNLEQARDGCDALAKAIYERMFGWVIRRINEDLNPTKQRNKVAASIGILDIAGFENLHVNSFEQLCINFVNERLQNFMNDHVFRKERAIYRDEGISCDDIDFKNNENIIDTFMKKQIGILNLLDEETQFKQGSDETFVRKVTTHHAKSEVIIKKPNDDPEFGICHFAGKVWYDCHGFLDKNRDTLNDDLFDCMKDSTNDFISDLFTIKKGPTGTISETHFHLRQSKKVQREPSSYDARQLSTELGKSLRKFNLRGPETRRYNANKHKTVISYFRESMDKLLLKMKRAEAHFVRCIKPNKQKRKDNFSAQYVKVQLLYNGITEIAKVRKNGFPIRKRHTDFYERFFVLHSEFFKAKQQNTGHLTKMLIEKIIPDDLKTSAKLENIKKVEFVEIKGNDEMKATVTPVRFEDPTSNTPTQEDGWTTKGMWPNNASSQTNRHDKSEPPQLRKRINDEKKCSSITRQDISTGSATSIPDNHAYLNTINTDEQKKKESKRTEKPFWDIFNNIPREKKTKDVHERSSLRAIKVIIYGLLFLLVFCSLVVQKISLMLLVNYENEERSNNSENGTVTQQVEGVDFLHAKYFLLVVAVCIPYALTVVIGFLRVLFGNIKSPTMKTMFVVLTIEGMHSVGLGFLVFKVLGELHAAHGIMVLNTTCFVPSFLHLFTSTEATDGEFGKKCRKSCKRVTDTIIDLLACVAQISVIPLVIYFDIYKMDVSTEEIIYIICCFLLCSLSWWENFMPDGTTMKNTTHNKTAYLKKVEQFILSIKFDLQEGRPFITAISSLLKIGVTILIGVLLPEPELNVVTAWKGLTSDEIFKFTPIICITTCSFVAYYMAYTACRLKLQVISFSLACFLSTPVAVAIAMTDCEYNFLSTFSKDSLNCQEEVSIDSYMYFIWGFIWFISIYWIARHIWSPNQERLAKVDKLFVNPLYCSILSEQHLLMNRRRNSRRIRKDLVNGVEVFRIALEENKTSLKKIPPMIYACATMWHENRQEMVQILKSLYRVDTDQFIRQKAVETYILQNENEQVNTEEFEYYEFEAHILFDDAYELDDNEEEMVPNKFVRLFTDVMQEAANAIHKKNIELRKPRIIPSPYGAQLVFLLPGNNLMYVHLKDKNKIRHRKRWSQVMYMYYLLGYRLGNECKERIKLYLKEDKFDDHITWDTEKKGGKFGKSQIFNFLDDEVLYRAENTFILALDGDVDFTPKAVRLLVDRMVKNEELGAACGRIHPIGKGPMVWYQKFEYAVAHWLQKSTEHVLGCVLCSPGCFSLFRGSALMDDNVMRKYTIKPTEASHHLMYDQGEDRWLCTLLLQQGYRVDYAAASDAYTYAPEGFGEFFNQRRRWMPSTIANIMDLLTDAKNTVSVNNNISWLYMVYQVNQLKDLRSILEITKKETKEDRGIQTDDLNEVVVETNKKKSVSWVDITPNETIQEENFITPTTDKPFDYLRKPKWTEDNDFKNGKVMSMTPEETIFWEEFIKRYLKPLDADKKEQETMKQALAQLRNEVVAGFAFINLIWISINFMFQLRKPAIIEFPKTPGAENVDDSVIKIDALGLMFIIFFVLILLIQFIGMVIHRWGTLMHLIAITEIPNPFKCGENQSHGNIGEESTEKLDAKKMIRFCADVVGEPMPDYSSDEDDDDEDEEDDKVEEELSNTIFNNAVRGVKGNIGGTRTPGLGMSFRETMVMGRDNISNNLRITLSSPNFRQTARNVIAISKRKYDEGTKPPPKGNVLRYRKNHPPMSRTDWEQTKKFGSTKPIFKDFINEIQNDRELKHKVRGLEKQTTGSNLTRTLRRDASATSFDEPVNDKLSGVGTLSRAFYKNLNQKTNVQTRQNPDRKSFRQQIVF
ncbi:CHS1 [Mytilus coruscus]|uniref:chitin synthase n=1 Tax=Mytilus coruscus TaxID=42192 RepID=A0A6J8AMR3_MYTCO|nr:CHS1 [Mytilus coruscus]